MTEDDYLMWLTSVEGIGSQKAAALMEHFGSAENIFCNAKQIYDVSGMTASLAEKMIGAANEDYLYTLLEKVENNNMQFVAYNNAAYPLSLKQIFDPPVGFYIKGEMPRQELPAASIVGARNCTQYGLTAANRLAKDLAACGIVIVSGMARGIDSMAHRGALEADGLTVAVLGSGLDICYPPENKNLYEDIIRNGCVISEFPPGERPLKQNFPIRNRIISGMCDVLIVVEAGERSGTSITVMQALEQGREIFSVPGSIFNKMSTGTNQLIQDGANPVTSSLDIIRYLSGQVKFADFFGAERAKTKTNKNQKMEIESLAPEANLVYACISLEPITVDEIVHKAGISIETTHQVLFELEIEGYIRKLPAQRYILSI